VRQRQRVVAVERAVALPVMLMLRTAGVTLFDGTSMLAASAVAAATPK